MRKRYDLRRSDNYPHTGRKSYACSGDGLITINTGFPVTSAVITWASLPIGNYNEESMSSSSTMWMSSSSSSSTSSSSSSSNSSGSSSSKSSSSSSKDSSSSSSNRFSDSSSSSSKEFSTESSSSSGGITSSSSLNDRVCFIQYDFSSGPLYADFGGQYNYDAINDKYVNENGINEIRFYGGTWYACPLNDPDPSASWVLGNAFNNNDPNLISVGWFNPVNTDLFLCEYCEENTNTMSSSSIDSRSSFSSDSTSSSSLNSPSSDSSSSFDFVTTQSKICVALVSAPDGSFDYMVGQYSYEGRGHVVGQPLAPSYISDNGLARLSYGAGVLEDGVTVVPFGMPGWWLLPSNAVNDVLTEYVSSNAFLGGVSLSDPTGSFTGFPAHVFEITLCPNESTSSEGISDSTSSQSLSSDSSSTNEWKGVFASPRIYVYDTLTYGFRVKYEHIPEELGYVEFSYMAM